MSLSEIFERIGEAEQKAGRAAGSVKLIAVSKKQPAERIEAIDVPFSEFLGIFEGLGRDSATMLASMQMPQ